MHVYYRKLPVLLVFWKVGDFMTINLVLGNIKKTDKWYFYKVTQENSPKIKWIFNKLCAKKQKKDIKYNHAGAIAFR